MKQMNASSGKWHIAGMEMWDQDYVDMEGAGFMKKCNT